MTVVRDGRLLTHSTIATRFPVMRSAGALECHEPFSLTHRVGHLGPITVLDLAFGVDTWIRCAEERSYYGIKVPIAGQIDVIHRNSPTTAAPGRATVCVPEGDLTVSRWAGHGRTIALRVDRNAVEDTLSAELGQEMTAQIAFKPSISIANGAARSWNRMILMLNEELCRPDSALTQPMVAKPFIDSFIRALLLAADHPYRGRLAAEARQIAPRTIRTAVEIIEGECHRPLTVPLLADRCQVSARALQQAFHRHFGMAPMAYLRQVRLRRAHEELLEADPTVETVSAIAKRWGFTNRDRFATIHVERYGEAPAATLGRSISRRSRPARLPSPETRISESGRLTNGLLSLVAR